jgi:hypothetical protein
LYFKLFGVNVMSKVTTVIHGAGEGIGGDDTKPPIKED